MLFFNIQAAASDNTRKKGCTQVKIEIRRFHDPGTIHHFDKIKRWAVKHNISISYLNAPVAQWIEHWIPNPCAASSILAGGTNKIKDLRIIM